MTSKAEARRRRKARSAFDIADIPKRDKSGCYVERTRQQPSDPEPQRVAIEARIRQTGMTPEQASSEMAGCAVGRRLMLDHIGDRADLWQAVKHMRRVIVAYDRSIGAPSRHAQCLRIMLPTERLEASASSPAPDLRDPEARDRQAVAAWTALKGWLSNADYAAQEACTRAVVDEPDEPISDWTGVVLALRCVAEGMRGQAVKVRARK